MKFNGRNLPVGTVLVVGVKYPTSPKVYSYGLMNVNETHGWYATGQGPQAAGWAVVERWLAKEGREVVWVKGVTPDAMPTLWTAEAASLDPVQESLKTDLERQVDEALGPVRKYREPSRSTPWPDPDLPSQYGGRKYERDLDDELDGIADVHGNFS